MAATRTAGPGRARPGLAFVALAVGVVASLVLGEVVLRVLRPSRVAIFRYPCVYQPDEQLGYRYVPGARGTIAGHFEFENPVEMNSLGFYDEEPADEASYRVLAVGDSFTAAMNLPKPQVWASVLERRLREGGHADADVVNLGIDGTGTDVHLDLLREYVPRFRPDAIVLAFYANDVGDVVNGRFHRECHRGYVVSYQTPEQRALLKAHVDEHLAKTIRIALFDASYLVRLVAAPLLPQLNPYRVTFVQPRLAELDPASGARATGLPRFRNAVRGLEALAERCACRLVVVPVPAQKDAQGSLDLWRRYATPSSLELFDPSPSLERERQARGLGHRDLFFPRDNHLNGLGNELYGQAVADALLADR